jgi:hypothetical protein
MRYLIAIYFMLGLYEKGFTQSTSINFTLNPIALLDIESASGRDITFQFLAPNEAGSSIQIPANNNVNRINITSAVTAGSTRRVDVQMLGSLPSGIRLQLQTTGPTASAVGNVGSVSNGNLYLSSSTLTIINNVGGGHTTNGVNRGFRLDYSMEIQDYSQLRASNQTVQILFTLADN